MSEAETKAKDVTGEGGVAEDIPGLVGQKLTLSAFHQLSSILSGYPFVKVVVDRPNATFHVINSRRYAFHADYIAENLLGKTIGIGQPRRFGKNRLNTFSSLLFPSTLPIHF